MFLIQAASWGGVGLMEHIGLLGLQRTLLPVLWGAYAPIDTLVRILAPSDWFFRGNVLYGFLVVSVGVCVYSAMLGLCVGFAAASMRKSSRAG
jgi:hypothetical protein